MRSMLGMVMHGLFTLEELYGVFFKNMLEVLRSEALLLNCVNHILLITL